MKGHGPMRADKLARRVGETKEFRNARTLSRKRNKAAKASRKKNR
jgi:hypothetical protein